MDSPWVNLNEQPIYDRGISTPNASMRLLNRQLMSLKKIISGGQTGADIAGIDAAIEHGMSYGGWLPKGRKTEKGPLDLKYTNMTEMSVGDYPEMTEQNVRDSDGTVIFTHGKYSGVSALTSNYAAKHNKPVLHLDLDVANESAAIESLVEWIYIKKIEILNVAGSRESKDEYIYDDVHSIVKSIIDTIKTAEILQKPQPPPASPSLQETPMATAHPNDTAAPERTEEDKAFHIPPQETTAVIPPHPQSSPSLQPSLQEALAPSSQVMQKEVAAEREANKGSGGISGLAFFIERLPKAVQKKNLVYIALSILILAIALMIIPEGVKNPSPETTTKKSLPLPEDRVSKTPGFSSDTAPAARSVPESEPQHPAALPTTADSTKEAGIPPLPSDAKPSPDSQAASSGYNPDIKTDNPSIAADQPEKKENAAPVNDSIDKTPSSNGYTKGTLESLSDTSGETETIATRQVPPEKKPPKSRYHCKSLYKKISLGEVLDKAETEFLAHNCN
jgi:predicted Rossmann-fold nucleotide-binding protein